MFLTDVEDKVDDEKEKFDIESMWSDEPNVQSLKSSGKSREKRQADQYEYTPTKTRCPLLLVADYRFFQEMGGGNTKTTINYLVCVQIIGFDFIFSVSLSIPFQISLIDRVHKIYNDTVWQDRSVSISSTTDLIVTLIELNLGSRRIQGHGLCH